MKINKEDLDIRIPTATLTDTVKEADKVDRNGCLYPRKVLEKAAEDWMNRGCMFGVIYDKSKYMEFPKFSEAACSVDLKMGEKGLMGTIETLDTEQGMMLFDLLMKHELSIGMSCTAFVTEKDGVKVIDGMKIKRISIMPKCEKA